MLVMKKKNILLLGSDGYLGSNLSLKLNPDIFSVDKFDLYPKSKKGEFIFESYPFLRIDASYSSSGFNFGI